jgi:hypothetical protein
MRHACQGGRHNNLNNLPRSLILINFHFGISKTVSNVRDTEACFFRIVGDGITFWVRRHPGRNARPKLKIGKHYATGG